MIIWNVTLRGKTLVSTTSQETAGGLVALLNDGTLYDVPGDPAAYNDARGARLPAPTTKAAAKKVDTEKSAVKEGKAPKEGTA